MLVLKRRSSEKDVILVFPDGSTKETYKVRYEVVEDIDFCVGTIFDESKLKYCKVKDLSTSIKGDLSLKVETISKTTNDVIKTEVIEVRKICRSIVMNDLFTEIESFHSLYSDDKISSKEFNGRNRKVSKYCMTFY